MNVSMCMQAWLEMQFQQFIILSRLRITWNWMLQMNYQKELPTDTCAHNVAIWLMLKPVWNQGTIQLFLEPSKFDLYLCDDIKIYLFFLRMFFFYYLRWFLGLCVFFLFFKKKGWTPFDRIKEIIALVDFNTWF